jgi:hypothetical protein
MASADHNTGRPPSGPRCSPLVSRKKWRVSSGTDRTDPLVRIRSAALDVLTVLRELEESAHVPLSDEAYDASSDRSMQSRVASPAELSDVPTDSSFLSWLCALFLGHESSSIFSHTYFVLITTIA